MKKELQRTSFQADGALAAKDRQQQKLVAYWCPRRAKVREQIRLT